QAGPARQADRAQTVHSQARRRPAGCGWLAVGTQGTRRRSERFDRSGQHLNSMNVLLLNAGSSSLKCTLMESADGKEIAHGLADWAGSATHYQYVGPGGKQPVEEVSGQGHAGAVKRFLHDLMHADP